MVHQEQSIYNVDHPSNYLTACSFGTFGFVGLLCNIFQIWLLCQESNKKNKPFKIILLGLCISDSLFCVSNIAEAYFIFHFQTSSSFGCKANGFLDYILGSSSLGIPAFVMVNRWFREVISNFLNYRFNIQVFDALQSGHGECFVYVEKNCALFSCQFFFALTDFRSFSCAKYARLGWIGCLRGAIADHISENLVSNWQHLHFYQLQC